MDCPFLAHCPLPAQSSLTISRKSWRIAVERGLLKEACMKTMLATLGMAAVLLSVTGCSAAPQVPDYGTSTRENLTGGTETAVWKAVPAKPDAEVVVHAEHVYAGDLADKCGPSYAVDMIVDFDTATTESLSIGTVTAFYLPHPGNVVVPRKLDTWMKQGATRDVSIQGVTYGPGDKARYELKHAYRLDADDPVIVLELETAGGKAPNDPDCQHVARYAFYPVIPH
jgi:hypothetical protein